MFSTSSLVNDGTLTSSAVAGTITIAGSNLTLAGTPNPITVTGGGSATITLVGLDAGLRFNSSYAFNAGSGGTVSVGASAETMTLADGVALSVAGGSSLNVRARTLIFGAGASISNSKSDGTAISV